MTATGLGSSPEMLLLGQRDGKLSLSSIPLLSGKSGSEPCSAPTERCLLRIAVAIAVNQKRALTRSAASRPYGVIRIISASPSCCFLPPEPHSASALSSTTIRLHYSSGRPCGATHLFRHEGRRHPVSRQRVAVCCLGGSAVSLANQNDWLSPGDKFADPDRQIGQGHLNGTWQVSRGRGKFLGLTHIDQDNSRRWLRGGVAIRPPRSRPACPRAAGGTNGTGMLSWRALRESSRCAEAGRFPRCGRSAGITDADQ